MVYPRYPSSASSSASPSGLPLVGTAGAVFIEYLVGPRLANRRDDWFYDLAERVRREAFVDAVATAAAAAARTSSQEKRLALRNAVLNAATGAAPDRVRQQIFLSLTDRFSDLHLLVLRFAQDARKLASPGKPLPRRSTATEVLSDIFSDAQANAKLYELVWSELYSAGLVELPKVENGYEGDAWAIKRTSNLGDQYLAFIRMSV